MGGGGGGGGGSGGGNIPPRRAAARAARAAAAARLGAAAVAAAASAARLRPMKTRAWRPTIRAAACVRVRHAAARLCASSRTYLLRSSIYSGSDPSN